MCLCITLGELWNNFVSAKEERRSAWVTVKLNVTIKIKNESGVVYVVNI